MDGLGSTEHANGKLFDEHGRDEETLLGTIGELGREPRALSRYTLSCPLLLLSKGQAGHWFTSRHYRWFGLLPIRILAQPELTSRHQLKARTK